jgi:multidrug efflux pump subunit AcrB
MEQIAGLASMNSTSSFGVSTITLQFVLDRPIDVAAQDVQAAINVALPGSAEPAPAQRSIQQTHRSSLAITSDSLPLDRVNDFADTLLAQKLSEVTVVRLVTIERQTGCARTLNPAAISALGLSLEDVRTFLAGDVNAPKASKDRDNRSHRVERSDFLCRRLQAGHRRLQNGRRFGSATLRTSSTAWRTTSLRRGSARRMGKSRRCCSTFSVSPGEHHSNRQRVKQLLPRYQHVAAQCT